MGATHSKAYKNIVDNIEPLETVLQAKQFEIRFLKDKIHRLQEYEETLIQKLIDAKKETEAARLKLYHEYGELTTLYEMLKNAVNEFIKEQTELSLSGSDYHPRP